MKKHLSIIVTVLVLQLSNQTFACSCMPVSDHFCGTLQNDTNIASVVMAQKIEDLHYGMKIRVLQLISGESIEDTVIVWGDNGALCRLYTGGWANGDTIILALHHTDQMGNIIYNTDYPPNLENPEDYHISGCGPYTLSMNNGIVSGPITTATMQFMPLAQFLAESCLYILELEEQHNLPPISLFPNPSTEQIGFLVKNGGELILNISIINTLGQEVYNQSEVSLNNMINISFLHPGVYRVILWNQNKRTSISFIKS